MTIDLEPIRQTIVNEVKGPDVILKQMRQVEDLIARQQDMIESLKRQQTALVGAAAAYALLSDRATRASKVFGVMGSTTRSLTGAMTDMALVPLLPFFTGLIGPMTSVFGLLAQNPVIAAAVGAIILLGKAMHSTMLTSRIMGFVWQHGFTKRILESLPLIGGMAKKIRLAEEELKALKKLTGGNGAAPVLPGIGVSRGLKQGTGASFPVFNPNYGKGKIIDVNLKNKGMGASNAQPVKIAGYLGNGLSLAKTQAGTLMRMDKNLRLIYLLSLMNRMLNETGGEAGKAAGSAAGAAAGPIIRGLLPGPVAKEAEGAAEGAEAVESASALSGIFTTLSQSIKLVTADVVDGVVGWDTLMTSLVAIGEVTAIFIVVIGVAIGLWKGLKDIFAIFGPLIGPLTADWKNMHGVMGAVHEVFKIVGTVIQGVVFITRGALDIIGVVLATIVALITGHVEKIGEIWRVFGERFKETITNLLNSVVDMINGFTNLWHGHQFPHFQVGTYRVQETGPAIVHKGERIIPEDRSTTINGSQQVVINYMPQFANEAFGFASQNAQQLRYSFIGAIGSMR